MIKIIFTMLGNKSFISYIRFAYRSIDLDSIFYVSRKLKLSEEIINKIIFVFLPIYAILAGTSPSVIRSVCMVFIYLVCIKEYK